MRIAIPNCRGRISPVLDVARRYRVIDVGSGRITDQAEHVVCGDPCNEFVKLAVDRVICAGVTCELQLCLRRRGIEVLADYCGGIDEIIDAYLCGRLGCGDYNVPGSRHQHREFPVAQETEGREY